MNEDKRKRLEAQGWKVGSVEEFLGFDKEVIMEITVKCSNCDKELLKLDLYIYDRIKSKGWGILCSNCVAKAQKAIDKKKAKANKPLEEQLAEAKVRLEEAEKDYMDFWMDHADFGGGYGGMGAAQSERRDWARKEVERLERKLNKGKSLQEIQLQEARTRHEAAETEYIRVLGQWKLGSGGFSQDLMDAEAWWKTTRAEVDKLEKAAGKKAK